MRHSKTGKNAEKVIWRMSQANPLGELVRASDHRVALPREAHERGRSASSLDLLTGADVLETPMDTLPGELIDAFAPSRPADEP